MEAKDYTEQYENAVRTVVAETENYWLNSAFIAGKQWVTFSKQRGALEEWRGSDPTRVRATMNRLWPASRHVISRLLQRELTFEVMPSAPDDATMRGATTAEAVLEDIRHRHGWEDIRTKNAWATWKGGVAAICVDWNPASGRKVGDLRDGDGESAVYEGDTVETPLSVAEFVVEPGSKNPVRARWWYKAQALPPEQVKSTFKLEKAPEADATNGLTPVQQGSMSLNVGDGGRKPELTRVLTYYERPNPSTPKGRVAVIIGKKVISEKPWPFPFTDRLNLAVTYETDNEQKWTGDTVVSMARPAQVLYNLAYSNIAEHMKNAGNARLAVPSSSASLMENLSDLPGEMFPYADGTEKPSYLSPPQLPAWTGEWPRVLADHMDDLLGVHDVSRGKAPVNIESGYGLSVLAEHDSTPVGRMVKSQAECWSQVATMVLELLAENVKETRTAMVTTAGGPPEMVKWSGKELQGQTMATVPVDAIIPRNRAALQAQADKMMQMGLIQDLETYATFAELPNQHSLIERANPDVARARRENSLMAIGRVQIPADFDDHEAHIREHNVFRKSSRYERMTDEERRLVDEHIQAHSTMAGELAGMSRQAAAIDPALAAVPQPDARPTISPDQLPPEAFASPELPGSLVEDENLDELAMLAEQAANI